MLDAKCHGHQLASSSVTDSLSSACTCWFRFNNYLFSCYLIKVVCCQTLFLVCLFETAKRMSFLSSKAFLSDQLLDAKNYPTYLRPRPASFCMHRSGTSRLSPALRDLQLMSQWKYQVRVKLTLHGQDHRLVISGWDTAYNLTLNLVIWNTAWAWSVLSSFVALASR